jgi:plastocyanin
MTRAIRSTRTRVAAMAGALLIVAAIAAPPAWAGSGCHAQEVSDGRGTVVEIAEGCFLPTVLRVDPGATVTFWNHDATTHSVTGASVSFGTFDQLSQDDRVAFRFDGNGVYPYFCVLHPGMVGAVVVGDGSGPGAAADGPQVTPVDVPANPGSTDVTASGVVGTDGRSEGDDGDGLAAAGGGPGGGEPAGGSGSNGSRSGSGGSGSGWWAGVLALLAGAALALGTVGLLTARLRRRSRQPA